MSRAVVLGLAVAVLSAALALGGWGAVLVILALGVIASLFYLDRDERHEASGQPAGRHRRGGAA